jgi:hypothetical protein
MDTQLRLGSEDGAGRRLGQDRRPERPLVPPDAGELR